MSDFRREDKYRVFKISDLQKAVEMYPDRKVEITKALDMLANVTRNARIVANKRPLFLCVCVEDDWRCYEEVWSMVEKEHEENK